MQKLIYLDTNIILSPRNGGILDVYFVSYLEELCRLTSSKIVLLGSNRLSKFFNEELLYTDSDIERLIVEYDIHGRGKYWIVDMHIGDKNTKFDRNNSIFLSRGDSSNVIRTISLSNNPMSESDYIMEHFKIRSFDFRESISKDEIKNKLDKFYTI